MPIKATTDKMHEYPRSGFRIKEEPQIMDWK